MKHQFRTFGFLVLGILGCDRTPDKVEFVSAGKPIAEVVVSSSGDAGKVVHSQKEELPLSLVRGAGSDMRFVDGKALSIFYGNIFPKRAYGYEICANITDLAKLPSEASACTDSIFSATESASMGIFGVNLPAANRGPQNVIPPQNLTLNYMRTLRAALSRECGYLVKTERAKLVSNEGGKNILVKGPQPKAEDLDEFFRTILGLQGTGIKVDVASPDYVTAFQKIVADASMANKEKAADEAYLGLCIAIAMNPQVIIY